MLWNAYNGAVNLGRTKMYYVSFGYGSKPLIILPGLSDGLVTVKGKAALLAKRYERFFNNYTVFMFSRKNYMPDNYSIRHMAYDQARAMDILGIESAYVMGVSQGGMIAQYLAIDNPEKVDKLVLAVTAARVNETIEANVKRWIAFAKQGRHKELMIDTAEKGYSRDYLAKYRKIYPIIGLIGKPSDYNRFLINASAILKFSAVQYLNLITCPTLIIAGEDDNTVGVEASYELHDRIKGSQIHVYRGLGHAAYQEAEDFNELVYEFLEAWVVRQVSMGLE